MKILEMMNILNNINIDQLDLPDWVLKTLEIPLADTTGIDKLAVKISQAGARDDITISKINYLIDNNRYDVVRLLEEILL